MTIPGFTAEASLAAAREHYGRVAHRCSGRGGRGVHPQLRGGGFRPRPGGGLSFGGTYWECVQDCQRHHSSCLATCEGTWESRKASRNCLLCDDAYDSCVKGCSGPIA